MEMDMQYTQCSYRTGFLERMGLIPAPSVMDGLGEGREGMVQEERMGMGRSEILHKKLGERAVQVSLQRKGHEGEERRAEGPVINIWLSRFPVLSAHL